MGLGRFRSEASVPGVSLSSDSAPLRDVQSLGCPEVPFEEVPSYRAGLARLFRESWRRSSVFSIGWPLGSYKGRSHLLL
jgi:hypothetical protein